MAEKTRNKIEALRKSAEGADIKLRASLIELIDEIVDYMIESGTEGRRELSMKTWQTLSSVLDPSKRAPGQFDITETPEEKKKRYRLAYADAKPLIAKLATKDLFEILDRLKTEPLERTLKSIPSRFPISTRYIQTEEQHR